MITKLELIEAIKTSKKVTHVQALITEFMEDQDGNYPEGWSLRQKVYHELFMDANPEPVLCPVCRSKPLKFNGLKKGYSANCSYSCRSLNPEVTAKAKQTNLTRYGTEHASQSQIFRERVVNTCLEKYGTDNVFKVEEIKNKQIQTVVDKYGVTNVSKNSYILKKINDVQVAQGRWRADHLRSDLEKYRLAVKAITARSYHDHYYVINPDNLPRSRFEYHVDHIYSVEEGFKNNVPAEVIGHYTNLRMMWHLDNCRKNTKCHITLEQLIEGYNNSIKDQSGTNST